MNVELAIAGLGCLVLAFGHTAIGLRWVLPNLTEGRLPSTPFGPPSMTLGMVRFTWNARRRPRRLLRLPVPLVFVVVAVMCWTASA
jgi:hypothetical protein